MRNYRLNSEVNLRMFMPTYGLRSKSLLGSILFGLLLPASAIADTVSVDAKATGTFGEHPDVTVPPVLDMVPGVVFFGASTVRITASGTIDLNPVSPALQNVSPDGLGPLFRGTTQIYSPLEEALVDASGTGALSSDILNGGALMGAFVSKAIVDSPGFLAKDDDFPNGGISSDKLFLIGTGPFAFTATVAGTLFFGINDVRASNNSGSFEVSFIAPNPINPMLWVGPLLFDD